VPVLWALISALWVGISSAAPELIWQGLKIALKNPSWADLVSALLIGLVLAFFIEPVMERARELLHRRRYHTMIGPDHMHTALFGAALSFVFAIISVLLHDAMIALISGEGPQHAGNSALTAGVSLAAAWALVPLAVTLAWHGFSDRRLAVPLGIAAVASPVIAAVLFAWPLATIITTEMPCVLILAAGYRELRRPPRSAAFVRCALWILPIAAMWLPIAYVIDVLCHYHGQFYGLTDLFVDARFYIGWAVGLALVPLPVDAASHAEHAMP
jgi:hypothetical protein